jgi:hypothetical protein
MRRAFAFPRYGRSDLFGSRARLAVAAATGVTLTYLYLPFDRPTIALDSGSTGSPCIMSFFFLPGFIFKTIIDILARRTRSIWVDEPPSEDKPTSSPDPEPPSTDGDESGDNGQVPGNEGAFNPETGEINWDCSCLGGMAHGPCGPEFREAFSCFVFSEQEPKGVDCVEKFKNMQDCFRRHPEVYGEGYSPPCMPSHSLLLIEYWLGRIR